MIDAHVNGLGFCICTVCLFYSVNKSLFTLKIYLAHNVCSLTSAYFVTVNIENGDIYQVVLLKI